MSTEHFDTSFLKPMNQLSATEVAQFQQELEQHRADEPRTQDKRTPAKRSSAALDDLYMRQQTAIHDAMMQNLEESKALLDELNNGTHGERIKRA